MYELENLLIEYYGLLKYFSLQDDDIQCLVDNSCLVFNARIMCVKYGIDETELVEQHTKNNFASQDAKIKKFLDTESIKNKYWCLDDFKKRKHQWYVPELDRLTMFC